MTQPPPFTDGEPAHARADDLPPPGWTDAATDFVVPRWHWPPWAAEGVVILVTVVLTLGFVELALSIGGGDDSGATMSSFVIGMWLIGMYAGYTVSERILYGRRPWPFRARMPRQRGIYWVSSAVALTGSMAVLWASRDTWSTASASAQVSILTGSMIVYLILYLGVNAIVWFSPVGRDDRERFRAAVAARSGP